MTDGERRNIGSWANTHLLAAIRAQIGSGELKNGDVISLTKLDPTLTEGNGLEQAVALLIGLSVSEKPPLGLAGYVGAPVERENVVHSYAFTQDPDGTIRLEYPARENRPRPASAHIAQ